MLYDDVLFGINSNGVIAQKFTEHEKNMQYASRQECNNNNNNNSRVPLLLIKWFENKKQRRLLELLQSVKIVQNEVAY